MKRTGAIRFLLLLLYCIPFVFLSVYGDATSGTMMFYVVMLVGFALLCWGALKTKNIPIIFIGNIASCVFSYIAAKLSSLEPMGEYFKPFTSQSLIILISVVSIFVHIIIVCLYTRKSGRQRQRRENYENSCAIPYLFLIVYSLCSCQSITDFDTQNGKIQAIRLLGGVYEGYTWYT